MADLEEAIYAQAAFATELFTEVRRATADGKGVTRDAFGEAEERAAGIVERAGRDLGLEVSRDAAANVYLTHPGTDRARGVLVGSHLDSVSRGGNYDGLAGVVAGMTILAALREAGIRTSRDVSTIGLRGEESVWFGVAYLGSKLALGLLEDAELDGLKRSDTGESLREHIRSVGGNPAALRRGAPLIDVHKYLEYRELHIEQGPILVERERPVAIPTAIRGNVRYPYARCVGEYAHSAAVPHNYRHDAVLAAAELLVKLEERWRELEESGHPDTVFTVGKLYTDPAHHAMTKVPGEIHFSLNFGATEDGVLEALDVLTRSECQRIGVNRGVAFELGSRVGSQPVPLDATARVQLRKIALDLSLDPLEFATVGHDAAMFAKAGLRAAMVLIRNDKGSHNENEQMTMEDFLAGCQVLGHHIVAMSH